MLMVDNNMESRDPCAPPARHCSRELPSLRDWAERVSEEAEESREAVESLGAEESLEAEQAEDTVEAEGRAHRRVDTLARQAHSTERR
jgi:hypothetical protein